MNSAISFEKVSKSLGNREILKDISFHVEQGDIFGYLGPNGAGKTTTIRVILGLFKPNSGKAWILGKDAEDDSARERVGFVLEVDGLYDNLTAYENLDYYCQIYGVAQAQAQAKVRMKEMLQLVGLSDRASDKVATYSKGMRQKLALARAMVHEPELLILDEPTAGVDPTGQMEVRDIILNMAHKKGKTIFLSSHNLDEVQRICNRIALIDKGEIKLYGELDKLRREMGRREVVIETGATTTEQAELLDSLLAELQALPYVKGCRREARNLYLNLDGTADVSQIIAMLSDRNIGVEQIRKGEVTLEEIYAKVVKGEEQ
jgi:ABC-2 type transport system ATP-binding protein